MTTTYIPQRLYVRIAIISAALLMALTLLAVPAAAQTQAPTTAKREVFDAAASYAIAHDSGLDATLPVGWVASAAVPLGRTLSVAGEVSGGYKTKSLSGVDTKYKIHGFMGGIRMRPARPMRVIPFGQLLVGAACYCGSSVNPTNTAEKSFAWQIGGGFDAPLADTWAIRAQIDYRNINGAAENFSQFRFAAGVVLRVK